MAVGHIFGVNFMGRCFGQRIILTTKYRCTTEGVPIPVENELQNIVDQLVVGGAVDLLTTYLALLPTTYAMEEIRAQRIYTPRSAYMSRVVTAAGTHASPATVANDSAALTLRGVLAGKRNRGTKHIGPVPDAASASGLIVAGYKTLLSNLGDKLIQGLTTANGSTYVPVTTGANPSIGSPEMVGYVVGAQSRVQRRRTVGLGE